MQSAPRTASGCGFKRWANMPGSTPPSDVSSRALVLVERARRFPPSGASARIALQHEPMLKRPVGAHLNAELVGVSSGAMPHDGGKASALAFPFV
jgi:hypothetical protein